MTAPASSRRSQLDQNVVANAQPVADAHAPINEELFLDPMMGAPLGIYIEKDVADKDILVDLIQVSRVLPRCTGLRIPAGERESPRAMPNSLILAANTTHKRLTLPFRNMVGPFRLGTAAFPTSWVSASYSVALVLLVQHHIRRLSHKDHH